MSLNVERWGDPEVYEGDVRIMIAVFVRENSFVVILLLFCGCLCITLLVHLYNLLRPFNEQTAHEEWVDRMLLMLEFEQANQYREEDAEEKAKYEATMELLGKLKEQMQVVKTAPTFLGVFKMNATWIRSIMSAIVVPISAFAVKFVQDTFTQNEVPDHDDGEYSYYDSPDEVP